jgi:hypothetical protein
MLALCSLQGQAQGPEAAEELYKRGREAIVNNHFPEAYEALREAWKLRRSYDIAALLGQAENQLQKYPEAAEHLSFSLRGFPASETGARRKRVEAALADAKKHVVEVEVTVNEAGADVIVDGSTVGRTPLDGAIFVSAGRHTIETRLESFEAANAAVEGKQGTRQSVALVLKKASTAIAAPSASAAPVQTSPALPDAGAPPAARPMWPVYAGAGLTLVGIGVGAAFLTMAHGKAGERDDVVPPQCGASTPDGADCARAKKLGDEAMRDQAVAQGAFVFAGVAAAFTATYLLWPRSNAPRVTAFGGRGQASVHLFGEF